MEHEYTVVIERDEDGAYSAVVPALRGCHSAGETETEALEMVKDAIRLNIELRHSRGEPIPREFATAKVRVPIPA